MEAASSLQIACRGMTREDFDRRYPYPWLVRELGDEEISQISFNTIIGESKKPAAAPRLKLVLAPGRLAARLATEAHRFGLCAVAKSQSNPWRDRVLVGRAVNNDVVLRDPSVSKVHAHFTRSAAGQWRLHAARASSNPTLVDGKSVDPGGEGVPLRSGATLLFGALRCEFIEGAELYYVLCG
jgi:hypothetical protein